MSEPRPYPFVARLRWREVEVEVHAVLQDQLMPMLDEALERLYALGEQFS